LRQSRKHDFCVAKPRVQKQLRHSHNRKSFWYIFLLFTRDRVAKSIGAFGRPNSQGKTIAHDQMVTCLDCLDTVLVSSSMDGFLNFWDIRKPDQSSLKKVPIDDSGIYKVALGPTGSKVAGEKFRGNFMEKFRGKC
jgi:WD40 repeat protein